MLGVVLCALFAPWLAPHNPQDQDLLHMLSPPAATGHFRSARTASAAMSFRACCTAGVLH
ncbi:hypothetical protein [Paraburkholderia sp.]|uniref:hypothetical protein n=1 Tax=Paraburkholderia sp. TaxID=1926495 RepID=UPI003D6E80DF